jgi:23S rRNA (uracil747-C5)-methyltransferase
MTSFCSYFHHDICRSCTLIESPIDQQISRKEELLKQSLSTLAPFTLLPSVSGPLTHFRNKAKMVVTGTVDQPVIGLAGEKAMDEGREILDCPVHHPKINQALIGLKAFITVAKLEPYQIAERRGELKTLILFYSQRSDEMYVRFVVRTTETLERIKKYAPALMGEYPYIKCISANLQPIPHAILEGPEEILLAGSPKIHHRLNAIELDVRPRAFVQTNQSVAEELYETAAGWVQEIRAQRFSELFCGQGAFSFFVQDHVQAGLGIEINPEAVDTANATAKKLGCPHLKFKASSAADVQSDLDAFRPDVVLVNPPRKGLGDAITYFKTAAYPYVIYSSCSHETLAKDLIAMTNYGIVKIKMFDMFPHTEHFETLVLLRHSGPTPN